MYKVPSLDGIIFNTNTVIQECQAEMKVQNEEIKKIQNEMKVRQDLSVANRFA